MEKFILLIIVVSLLGISGIILGILTYYKVKEQNKYKRIICSYKIGQRPIIPDLILLPYPYITIERKGIIIFLYNTGKKNLKIVFIRILILFQY